MVRGVLGFFDGSFAALHAIRPCRVRIVVDARTERVPSGKGLTKHQRRVRALRFGAKSDAVQFAIFVGHEPNLSEAMLDLTGMRSADSEIELKKGGCYGIRIEGPSAHLEWMLPPGFLAKTSD